MRKMKTELKRLHHIMIIFVHPILIKDYTVFKYGISHFFYVVMDPLLSCPHGVSYISVYKSMSCDSACKSKGWQGHREGGAYIIRIMRKTNILTVTMLIFLSRSCSVLFSAQVTVSCVIDLYKLSVCLCCVYLINYTLILTCYMYL